MCCSDCFRGCMCCSECLLEQHAQLPLHQIQLEHMDGKCYMKQCGPVHFTVIDINGIHQVNIDFCQCGNSPGGYNNWVQLLCMRWYPAMPEHPCTAFTFDYLNTFHLLTLQGKINLYDYYKAILWKTDNVALQKQVYHWNKASMVVYQWQHLKMLKKAGRGHDLTGIEATKVSKCTVECPACPHPSINLEDG
ncbi:hypothetical protein BKA93DRAFT_816669 [Sparassis latifolia]